MRYVILDLEATCWAEGNSPARMETIEIGAVMLDSASGPISSEFTAFVKPVLEPTLSDFCTQLTSIRQEDVGNAETFDIVFPKFVEWIGDAPFRLCSWGGYDLGQFRTDCGRHALAFPSSFESHINLKREFSHLRGVKLMGMKAALGVLKILLEGTHHRGIDDARNITKIALTFLPRLETTPS